MRKKLTGPKEPDLLTRIAAASNEGIVFLNSKVEELERIVTFLKTQGITVKIEREKPSYAEAAIVAGVSAATTTLIVILLCAYFLPHL